MCVCVCGQPTRDNVDDAIRNSERLVELFCRPDHLVEHLPRLAVMRRGVDELLNLQRDPPSLIGPNEAGKVTGNPAHLLKLVDPEDPAGVPAVGAHFLPEAGGEAGVADGQVLGLEPLVPQEGGDGLLRGGDEVLLVDGIVVGLLAALADDLG